MGYAASLGILLQWLDRAMLWLEDVIVWQWVQKLLQGN